MNPLRRQAGINQRRDHRSQQNANRQAGSEGAAGDTNALFRHVFGDKNPGAGHFPSDSRPLQNAHQQQQQRRGNACRRVGRQQTNRQRRQCHQQNAQGEHLLAPDQIAEVGHDNAAQWTRQVARGKDAEGLHLAQPFRDIRREEQFANDGGEEDKDNEIIKLQRAAKGGQRQGFIILSIQRSGML